MRFACWRGSGAGRGGKRMGEFGRGGKRPIKKPAIGGGLSLGGKRRDSLATIASYLNSSEHSVAIHTQWRRRNMGRGRVAPAGDGPHAKNENPAVWGSRASDRDMPSSEMGARLAQSAAGLRRHPDEIAPKQNTSPTNPPPPQPQHRKHITRKQTTPKQAHP